MPELVDAGAGTSAVAGPAAPPIDAAAPPARKPATARIDDESARIEAEARRMADLLTSDDSRGATINDMSKRKPGADLGSQIDSVRTGGGSVAIGGGGARGGGAVGGGPSVGTGSGSGAKDSSVVGRISIASKTAFDTTTLTVDDVVRKIQMAYMAGLKRCQKQLLATDATARGRLEIALTVNEAGRVTSPKVRGFDATLDSCVSGQVSRWMFPPPKDADGEVTDASFSIVLQLTPD